MRNLSYLFLLLTMSGCVSYEYEITRPTDLARHIGKQEVVVPRDPLDYRLQTFDDRLVMRIYNPTDDTITLVGPQSSAVDPQGQSHPFRTQTMASHSFIKIILPPQPPTIERSGPSIGIGFGGVIGRAGHRRFVHGDEFDDEPQYFTVVSEDTYYWDWNGESQVRLLLVFDRNGKTFDHEFVIARKKK
jgi:hypothetical protein